MVGNHPINEACHDIQDFFRLLGMGRMQAGFNDTGLDMACAVFNAVHLFFKLPY